jgi:hypothetical protein
MRNNRCGAASVGTADQKHEEIMACYSLHFSVDDTYVSGGSEKYVIGAEPKRNMTLIVVDFFVSWTFTGLYDSTPYDPIAHG